MGFQEEDMPGQQPDPEFKAFFAGEWRELHGAVEIPGMRYASWDRKAAYIVWCLIKDQNTSNVSVEEAIAYQAERRSEGATPAPEPKPIEWAAVLAMPIDWACPVCHGVGGHASSCPNGPKASVGKPDLFVNPAKDADCAPEPGGIVLAFDSAKW